MEEFTQDLKVFFESTGLQMTEITYNPIIKEH